MNIYIIFLNLIFTIKIIYGKSDADRECEPINKILGMNSSYDCCSYNGITCSKGHIIEM